ncbi:uncharacterized protein LOC115996451 [Ipomoea triloba]|uniref:uncharacterized protein LOC115996451 n=1 Tax=Ipomoea triloba TaxID=35885 RepID=UPI00125DDAA1|nr:uncharacterized protein LOC115996451 [Ipomoea triloba]
MSDDFLVYYALYTLPSSYGPFKISYNTHKEKWSINDLMTICVQEEGRLMMEMGESAMLATAREKSKSGKSRGSTSKAKGKGNILPQADIKKVHKCFFCKKKGHMKKDCIKYKKWVEKKGNAKSEEAGGK